MSIFGCCCDDQLLLDGVLIPTLPSEQDQITWPKLFSKYFYGFIIKQSEETILCNTLLIYAAPGSCFLQVS
jgi:hypothetical protein